MADEERDFLRLHYSMRSISSRGGISCALTVEMDSKLSKVKIIVDNPSTQVVGAEFKTRPIAVSYM